MTCIKAWILSTCFYCEVAVHVTMTIYRNFEAVNMVNISQLKHNSKTTHQKNQCSINEDHKPDRNAILILKKCSPGKTDQAFMNNVIITHSVQDICDKGFFDTVIYHKCCIIPQFEVHVRNPFE